MANCPEVNLESRNGYEGVPEIKALIIVNIGSGV